jgi:hypothetical protein
MAPTASTPGPVRARPHAGGGASRGRKLYSPAALADPRDREALREMAAHGFQVRIATAPLPREIVIIDRRTMILTDPAPPPRPPAAPAPPPRAPHRP